MGSQIENQMGRKQLLFAIIIVVVLSVFAFLIGLLIELVSILFDTEFDIPVAAFDVLIQVLSIMLGLVIAVGFYSLTKIEEMEDRLEKAHIVARQQVKTLIDSLTVSKKIYIELEKKIAASKQEGKSVNEIGKIIDIKKEIDTNDQDLKTGYERLNATDTSRNLIPSLTNEMFSCLNKSLLPMGIFFGMAVLYSALGYVIDSNSTFILLQEVQTDRFLRIVFLLCVTGPAIAGIWKSVGLWKEMKAVLARYNTSLRAANNMAYRSLSSAETLEKLKLELKAIAGM